MIACAPPPEERLLLVDYQLVLAPPLYFGHGVISLARALLS